LSLAIIKNIFNAEYALRVCQNRKITKREGGTRVPLRAASRAHTRHAYNDPCKYYKLHFYYKPLKNEYMPALCDSAFNESELKNMAAAWLLRTPVTTNAGV
jgi:hypothetical protein